MHTYTVYHTVLPGDIPKSLVFRVKALADTEYRMRLTSLYKSSRLANKFYSVIEVNGEGDYYIRVITVDKVLVYLENGTAPHKLAKSGKSKTVFIKGVGFRKMTPRDLFSGKWVHPGTTGQYLAEKSWDTAIKYL